MTYEEMQKTMQFILEMQAQSSVKIDALSEKIDALTETQKRSEQRQDRAEEIWTRTEESIRSLLSIAEIHEREITALGESLRENVASLREAGRATDERLNALVGVVERMISEGRNGK